MASRMFQHPVLQPLNSETVQIPMLWQSPVHHVLGLLELSRPQIFLARYIKHLEDAMGCYMDMVDAFLFKRDSFFGIIDRLVSNRSVLSSKQ